MLNKASGQCFSGVGVDVDSPLGPYCFLNSGTASWDRPVCSVTLKYSSDSAGVRRKAFSIMARLNGRNVQENVNKRKKMGVLFRLDT